MTREEHIENLKAIASDMPSDKCADWIESLMAGVKALEQEPCDDAISRQAVEDAIYDYSRSCDVNYAQIMEFIDKLPSVTPQQKMGHWEWNQYDANPKIGNFHCSLCHSIGRAYFDYCPYCGAKMSEIPTDSEGSEE